MPPQCGSSKNEAGGHVYARKVTETSSERVVRRALDGVDSRGLRSTRVEPAELRADEAEIALALRHLIDNAIEADPGSVDVVGTRGETVYAFRVSNDGPALDASRLAQLVRPFVSEKGGRGLGLTIARRVAERYGGGIRAAGDGGTSVELFLPYGAAEGG